MTDPCFDGKNCPETGKPCLTPVALREYLECIFNMRVEGVEKFFKKVLEDFQNSVEKQFNNFEKATNLAAENLIRTQAAEAGSTFALKTELKELRVQVNKDLIDVRDRIGTEIGTLRNRHDTQIVELQRFQSKLEGKASSGSVLFAGAIALLGVLLGILDLLIRLK